MHPVVDKERCRHCGNCASICPAGVLRLTEKGLVVEFPENCIGCCACELECSYTAIKVKDE